MTRQRRHSWRVTGTVEALLELVGRIARSGGDLDVYERTRLSASDDVTERTIDGIQRRLVEIDLRSNDVVLDLFRA